MALAGKIDQAKWGVICLMLDREAGERRNCHRAFGFILNKKQSNILSSPPEETSK